MSSSCRLISVTLFALLSACRVDSPEPATGPALLIAAGSVADAAPQFSEWSAPVNLGAAVNSDVVDQAPSISKDGLSIYFHSGRPGGMGGLDIWVSQRARIEDPWGPPQNLGPEINTPFNDGGPALSIDGHRLFFNSNRPGGLGDNDIYVARRRDKRDDFGWAAAVNLGSGVNSVANDNAPAVVDDEWSGTLLLYFASNRSGGMGGLDIYASALLADETFGPAALVDELSSPFNDGGPVIRRDGLELFLDSNRPGALGGEDIWVATRASVSDPWSPPVHLGEGINSVNFEGAAALSFDGTSLYFHAARRPENVGVQFDLWVTTRSKLKQD